MRKVLLILESTDLCNIIAQELSSKYIVECRNSFNARMQPIDSTVDALVLDLFLPGTDGFSLLHNLSGKRPPVIILLTKLLTNVIYEEASHSGISEIILKPFSVRYLINILEKNLAK